MTVGLHANAPAVWMMPDSRSINPPLSMKYSSRSNTATQDGNSDQTNMDPVCSHTAGFAHTAARLLIVRHRPGVASTR